MPFFAAKIERNAEWRVTNDEFLFKKEKINISHRREAATL